MPNDDTFLPSRMRTELRDLADHAGGMDRPILEHVAGAVFLDRRNSFHFGLANVSVRVTTVSYRAREAVLAGASTAMEGTEWVTINSSVTLRQLLDKYGERLLGFDVKLNEVTIELFLFDIIDSTAKTVRILVRKPLQAVGA